MYIYTYAYTYNTQTDQCTQSSIYQQNGESNDEEVMGTGIGKLEMEELVPE